MALATLSDFLATKFDYVVIGGGGAGLVVAGRLSEDKDVIVGVLEAGEDRSKDPMVMIPGLATQLPGDDKYDWNFKTVPQVCWKSRISTHG
jgi:choline dehydrogenase-like flavoprotein